MAKRSKKNQDDQNEESVSLIPIMNLVCLLIPFLLYTASFVVFSTVDVHAQRNVPCTNCTEDEPPSLNLMVVITDRGFRVANSGEGALPSSCGAVGDDGGGAMHIPLSGSAESCVDSRGYPSAHDRNRRQALRLGPPSCAYDFSALRQCMEDVKADHPDQERVIISGESNTDYDVLIHAMDTTRGSSEEPLFPNVSLAAGVA
jgi:biopolymer transport protein ExbD